MLWPMPELPEVETVVRFLGKRLVARTLTKVRLSRNDIVATGGRGLARRLTGARVEAVRRRGKLIVIDFQGGTSLAIHLRMTGQLVVRDAASTENHVHFTATLDDGAFLVYRDIRRFGRFYYGATVDLDSFSPSGAMGPEPLELSEQRFSQLLRSQRRMLKALLLDQSFLAGLGNIYVDEALFAARLHPRTPSSTVSDRKARELGRAITAVLQAAIRAGGTTISDYVQADGSTGGFKVSLEVYGRTGSPCPRCARPITHITAAGRSTHICGQCQRPRK